MKQYWICCEGKKDTCGYLCDSFDTMCHYYTLCTENKHPAEVYEMSSCGLINITEKFRELREEYRQRECYMIDLVQEKLGVRYKEDMD